MIAAPLARRSSHRRLQYVAIAVFSLVITAQALASWRGPAASGLRDVDVARDFMTFYCAGATTNARGNPYLVRDFSRCGTPPDAQLPSFARAGVWPAPLPPYDVAFFRIFALLPYRIAAALWLALSLAALTLAVALVSKIADVEPLAIFAAIALPFYYADLQWGQLPAVVCGALASAAYALRARAERLAALAALVTLIEPHIGVPVCLAIALCVPKTRATFVLGAIVLAVISIATLGFETNVAYYRTILPLQALAEAPASNQYSATWLAYVAGLSEHAALAIGSVVYLVMAALGIFVTRALARTTAKPELLAVLPAAFAVFGGVFVHATQLSIAMLAGFLLLSIARDSPVLWLGLLLEIPFFNVPIWTQHPYSLVRIESFVAVVVFGAFANPRFARGRRLLVGGSCGIVYLALSTAILHVPTHALRTASTADAYVREIGIASRYTTGTWGVHIRDDPANRVATTRTLVGKIPRLLGLVLILGVALASLRERGPFSKRPDRASARRRGFARSAAALRQGRYDLDVAIAE